MDQKIDVIKPEEIPHGFGFERALLLMKEGRHVKPIDRNDLYHCNSGTLYKNNVQVVSLSTHLIVNSLWVQA